MILFSGESIGHRMYISYMDTPVGLIEIQASSLGIRSINYCDTRQQSENSGELIERCKQQLHAYFEGERTEFDIPLDQQGSEFQLSVWQALKTIPFGKTASYGDIANHIDNPKSVRAVGGANNKNSVSIIVPCHRVIGSEGTLVGYAVAANEAMTRDNNRHTVFIICPPYRPY